MNEGNYGSTFNPQRERGEVELVGVDRRTDRDWMAAEMHAMAELLLTSTRFGGDNDGDKKR